MTSSSRTHRQRGFMFRIEVALLLSIVGSGAWMALPGCSSAVVDARKITRPASATGQFGTESAFRHLVERTQQMDARPLQATTGPRVSDNFPDVVLTSHRNQSLRFRSDLVRDRIVCFAMFYTRCTGSCPGTMSKVLALRRSLSTEFKPADIHFVCITLDPEHDGVEQLQKYANTLGIEDTPGLPEIHLCTGTQEAVDSVRRTLGMYDPDPEVDADRSQHAAMLVTGNDRFNRWASSPSGLKLTDLQETVLRIAGESERQRFAGRFAIDSGFSLTSLQDEDHAKGTQSCCQADGTDTTGNCCSNNEPPAQLTANERQ
jgi:protein SCO1/2